MKAHIVENGIIVNTIIVDSIDIIPGLIDGENEFGPGDLFDGTTLSHKPPPPRNILNEIAALEFSVTERMRREAIIGKTTTNPKTSKTAKQMIADIDAEIDLLRALL